MLPCLRLDLVFYNCIVMWSSALFDCFLSNNVDEIIIPLRKEAIVDLPNLLYV